MDNIKKLAKNLIKAIDENSYNAEVDRTETELIIIQRFIADELEKLRSALK